MIMHFPQSYQLQFLTNRSRYGIYFHLTQSQMLPVAPPEDVHITALHPIALEGAGSSCWYGGDHCAPVPCTEENDERNGSFV